MDKLLEHIISSLYPLVEGYSPKVMKQLVAKFKEQSDDFDIEIDDNKLELYINRFDQIKNSPKIKEKDLLKWDLDDLIQLITSAPVKGEGDGAIANPDNIIHNDDALEIHDASTEDKCIRLKSHDPSGAQESWCIGRGSFDDHRYNERRGFPNYYYFIDKEKYNNASGQSRHEDFDYSFFVISINNRGEYEYTRRDNRPNYSGAKTWEEITTEFPILANRGIENKLRYIPISDSEKVNRKYKNRAAHASEFRKFPFHVKKQYLVYRKGTNRILSDVTDRTFITNMLPQYPKLSDFVSVTPGLVESELLLMGLESFNNQQVKSIISNLRDGEGPYISEFLKPDKIPFEVIKLVVKFKPKYVRLPQGTVMHVSDNGKFVLSVSEDDELGLQLSALTEKDYYPKVKINDRTIKHLKGADLSSFPSIRLISTAFENELSVSFIGDSFDKVKQGTIKGIKYKEHNGSEYIIIPQTLKAYKVEDDRFITMDYNSEEIKEVFSGDLMSSMLGLMAANMNLPRGVNTEALFQYIRELPLDDRMLSTEDTLGTDTIMFYDTQRNEIHLLPQLANNLTDSHLSLSTYVSQGQSRSNAPSLNVYEEYFAYLRETNQSISDSNLRDLLNRGYNMAPKLLLILSNPPYPEDSEFIPVAHNGIVWLLHKVTSRNSLKVSSSRGRLIRANLSTTQAQELAGDRITYTRARRGRQPAPTDEPETPTETPVDFNGSEIYTVMGTNNLDVSQLPTAVQTRLRSAPMIARSTINDRGVSRRNGLMQGEGEVTRFWTIGENRIYLINMADEGGNFVASITLQPGNIHYILTPQGAHRLQSPRDLLDALREVGTITEIKKYIIKEYLRIQQDTMNKDEIQDMIKEAIKEIMAENQPAQEPETQEPETIPYTPTKPGEKKRRRRIGNPDAEPKPKAQTEGEEDILNKIAQRFSNKQ